MCARNVRLWSEEDFAKMMKHLKEKGDKALREDPFFNPVLRKDKKTTEKKKAKKFEGYNWITHKKKIDGMKVKIKSLESQKEPDDEEKLKKLRLTIRRMKSLLAWHTWAWSKHKEGWSDKRIHQETLRRRQSKK